MNRYLGMLAAAALAAAYASSAGAAAKADELCALLTPADFQAAGVPGAKAPNINPDDQGAYCVYAGKSSATGGIELDVFVTKDGDDAKGVYETMRGEAGRASKTANPLPGVDQSELANVAGPPAFTTIAVRKGKLVFAIGVPTTPKSRDTVVSLTKLVLQRGEKLAR